MANSHFFSHSFLGGGLCPVVLRTMGSSHDTSILALSAHFFSRKTNIFLGGKCFMQGKKVIVNAATAFSSLFRAEKVLQWVGHLS